MLLFFLCLVWPIVVSWSICVNGSENVTNCPLSVRRSIYASKSNVSEFCFISYVRVYVVSNGQPLILNLLATDFFFKF